MFRLLGLSSSLVVAVSVSVWLLRLTGGTSFVVDVTRVPRNAPGTNRCDTGIPRRRSCTRSRLYAATHTNEHANKKITHNVKLLILPGFGNVLEDYILPSTSNPNDPYDESTTTMRTGSLLQSFLDRGWKYQDNIFILPIQQRYEWIQVFLYGLFDVQFLLYSNAPPTNPAFVWYLQKIHTMIQEQIVPPFTTAASTNVTTTATTTKTEIILIGHSAGGWLGRAAIAYLLHQQQQQNQQRYSTASDSNYIIRGLVTLGTPNLPPPITAMDMTRGALRYTDTHYPGAYQHYHNRSSTVGGSSTGGGGVVHEDHSQNDNNDVTTANTQMNSTIFYITVCGNSVQGQKNNEERSNIFQPKSTSTTTSPASSTSTRMARFAYNSYEAVCGDGTTCGDGVVPLCAAHLDQAIQITLPNIYHSINVPEQWYGTDTVSAFDMWYNCMMEQIHSPSE